jgi:hypothetical protein
MAAPDVHAYPLDDELVLYDVRTNQAFVLNGTGAEVWELCDGTREAVGIAREIVAAYSLELEQALDDMRELIRGLREAELITLV